MRSNRYEKIYPEQYKYMKSLKTALDAKGHALLEMPTGTGKTAALLSLITSYKEKHREVGKFIYCTRTVHEMDQCITELKQIENTRKLMKGDSYKSLLGLCLSSRSHLCINEEVINSDDYIDSLCRGKTARWVRQKSKIEDPESMEGLCEYFEKLDTSIDSIALKRTIYSLEDLKNFGKSHSICPYFLARQMLLYSDVIIFNYQYLLDPKVSSLISSDLEKECIVVFDEAHNIDSVCVESLTVILDTNIIKKAEKQIHTLESKVQECEMTQSNRLKEEYLKLVGELTNSQNNTQNTQNTQNTNNTNSIMGGEEPLGPPVITSEILSEIVPGNIRKAKKFIEILSTILAFIKDKICSNSNTEMETPLSFRLTLQQKTGIDERVLKACSARLSSLLLTLQATNYEEFHELNEIANFCTLVGTFLKGFMIIKETYNPFSKNDNILDPIYELACLDASISIKHVFDYFQSVIITSGTLSPIEFYPKILEFQPKQIECFEMSVHRNCLCPLVISKGSDMNDITTKFDVRHDSAIVRNYAELLLQLARTIPDGITWFFPSYDYMEWIIGQWDDIGVLKNIMEYKLVFFETKDAIETSCALNNYRRACDSGRGGIFLSIARGKVAEGINFDGHYGRCVVICGIPFLSSESKSLEARENYLRSEYNINENEFYIFDAMRQTAQCTGRVIRGKNDYGVVIYADKRYTEEKRKKLPVWINQFMKSDYTDLCPFEAIQMIKKYLKDIVQPVDDEEADINSLSSLTKSQLEEYVRINHL